MREILRNQFSPKASKDASFFASTKLLNEKWGN